MDLGIVDYFGVDKKALSVINKINFLVRTEEDKVRLEELITLNSDLVNPLWSALCQLHLEKVNKNNMPLEVFINRYEINNIKTLEELFQEKIDKYVIGKLSKKISNGKITLEELYNKHQAEPHKPILGFVK